MDSIKEVEFLSKILHITTTGPDGLMIEFTNLLRKNNANSTHTFFQKRKAEEVLPN